MQEAFNAKAQRGEAATEAERDRSPVAAAPHEAGCQVKPDVPLRSGPLRAGGPPARRRFRRFFAACEQLGPLQCKGVARFWSHSWAAPFGERQRAANPFRIFLWQLCAFASLRLCVDFRLSFTAKDPLRAADCSRSVPQQRSVWWSYPRVPFSSSARKLPLATAASSCFLTP